MSLKKQALSSVYWTGLQQFGSQGINFVVSVILARLLLPEEFGLIGMISIFLAVGRSLIDSGLTQSLIRSQEVSDLGFSTVFYFNIIGSFLIYGICYLSAPVIAAFYDQPILTSLVRWYTIVFIINALSGIQTAILVKTLNFRRQFIIQLPSLVLSSIVGISMAYLGYGVWSLVVSALAQASLNSAQLWYYSSWRPQLAFSKSEFRTHFNYGYKLTFSGIIDTIYNNIYTVIIGRYFSATQLGFYTRANTLKQLPVNNISSIINKVTFPLFAKIQQEDERLRGAYKKIMQMVIFVIAPILLISAALAEPLFRFLLTEKWLPAVPYYQILCWVGILYPLNAYNLSILKVKGRSDLFLKLEIVKKIIGILIITFSIHYGIYGLLWGSLFTSVIAFFVNAHYTGIFLNYPAWLQLRDILPLIFIAFLAAVGAYIFDQWFAKYATSDLLRLLIGTAGSSLIYLILIWLFMKAPLLELLKITSRK